MYVRGMNRIARKRPQAQFPLWFAGVFTGLENVDEVSFWFHALLAVATACCLKKSHQKGSLPDTP